jgi:hypothetical protein
VKNSVKLMEGNTFITNISNKPENIQELVYFGFLLCSDRWCNSFPKEGKFKLKLNILINKVFHW